MLLKSISSFIQVYAVVGIKVSVLETNGQKQTCIKVWSSNGVQATVSDPKQPRFNDNFKCFDFKL